MILNEQVFDIKIINQNNGELILYIPPQQVSAMKMTKVINEISNLVITFPFNQTIWDSFSLDRLVEVSTINYETNLLEKEETFLLRKQELYYEESIQQIAFSCVGLNHLLKRRVVKPTDDDIANAGGWVTRSGLAGIVFEEFVNEQIINPDDVNREFPNISFNKISNGNTIGIRTRYKNLFEVFDEMRINGQVDFRIVRDSLENLIIEVGVLGDDLSYTTNFPSSLPYLLFSPNIGNTINPFFDNDFIDQENLVFVLGEGEGSNQKILELNGVGLADSIFNRIETIVESRKGERSLGSANQQSLLTGLKKLNESRVKRNFKFGIFENRLGFRYRVDWDIGDIVTFYWQGEMFDFQIKGTTLTINGNQINRELDLTLKDD